MYRIMIALLVIAGIFIVFPGLQLTLPDKSEQINHESLYSNTKIDISRESTSDFNITTSEYIEKDFGWNHGLFVWTWNSFIDMGDFDYFKNLKRPLTNDYSIYITNPLDDSYIQNLAKTLREGAQEKGFSEQETINFVVAFVQNLEYIPDDISTGYDEYPKYPLETLVDGGGDCEDTSILMASLLRELGYGVVLLAFSDHMAVGVKGENTLPGSYYNYQGEKYYYLETTAQNRKIGEIPKELKNQQAKIYPLVAKPIITHTWTAKTTAGRLTKIKVKLKNEGTATARNTTVYAAFDAGEGLVYDQTSSKPFNLEPQEEAGVTLDLKYTVKAGSRLVVKIISDGVLLDESFSE